MKTYILEVYIEHQLQQLNRPFTYLYQGLSIPVRGIRVRVPFHKQSLIGYVTKVTETTEVETLKANSPFSISEIDTLLDENPILSEELLLLVDYQATHYFSSKIALLQAMLPPSLFPSKRGLTGPKIAYEFWLKINPKSPLPTMSGRQLGWWQMVEKQTRIRLHDIKSKAAIAYLTESGLASIEKEEKRRFIFNSLKVENRPTLTTHQQQVIDEFNASKKLVYLLEGVTGSGKTEVYLNLSENIISSKKSVLMIVPEIALTPVMMSYYRQRFGEKVAILHSGLTPAEKFDEYRRILKGQAVVVVGARSAVFAPLQNLGLIILDEEHSETYKQDNAPHYHAREIALWRSQYHQCKLLMGTATPSLESRARAQKGLYQLLSLPQRIHDQHTPKTTIVDMTDTKKLSRESSLFSIDLLKAIEDRLSKKQQVILLINRRGYAQSVICRSCQHLFVCPDCQVPLAFHSKIDSLKCHYCDYIESLPKECPSCQSHQLMKQGFGTEQVVSILEKLFPKAKIGRLDADMTGLRSSITETLKQVQDGFIDILVGTQMVAKGHDFPNVTLVGVMLADLGLHVPHYRASERTFQLIAQVVGRTGRGTQSGEAIIQTTMPQHYSIVLGSQQNYKQFYLREMNERKTLQYPPYTYLARFELSSTDQENVDEIALELHQLLVDQLGSMASVIGPNIPYPEYFAGFFRRRVLIKYKDYQDLYTRLNSLYELLVTKKQVKINFNIDPYDH
jgi:primosomal protein N' (replication factor Y)